MYRLFFALLPLLLSSCVHALPIGPVSRDTLRSEATQFTRLETADPIELARLKALLEGASPVKLTVYFSEWCGDSIRELPRLLVLTDALQAAPLQLNLIHLDGHKTDPAGLAKAAGVLRTPTIVVSRDGRELGRIVEKPVTTIGGDLIELLNKAH